MTNASNAVRPANPQRRKFLLTAGVGISGAAAVSVVVDSLSPPARAPAEAQSQDRGYQPTEHVRNYYRSARV